MSEMYAQKKKAVLSDKTPDHNDLMVAMIKNANVTSDPTTQTLSDSEILGNAFVFILVSERQCALRLPIDLATRLAMRRQRIASTSPLFTLPSTPLLNAASRKTLMPFSALVPSPNGPMTLTSPNSPPLWLALS